MASFPGSAASLIPRLSPPPVFERRVTWNKAMQRMPMFQRTRIVRVSVRYILLSWCVMCLPCSRFRLQRQQFESDAILQYLMLYWVWGWPQGKHYDTIEYTCMCVYIVKVCTDPCMYRHTCTVDWEVSPLQIFRQLLRQRKLNVWKFLTCAFNFHHLATRRKLNARTFLTQKKSYAKIFRSTVCNCVYWWNKYF